jgi:hypothetical protein
MIFAHAEAARSIRTAVVLETVYRLTKPSRQRIALRNKNNMQDGENSRPVLDIRIIGV